MTRSTYFIGAAILLAGQFQRALTELQDLNTSRGPWPRSTPPALPISLCTGPPLPVDPGILLSWLADCKVDAFAPCLDSAFPLLPLLPLISSSIDRTYACQ